MVMLDHLRLAQRQPNAPVCGAVVKVATNIHTVDVQPSWPVFKYAVVVMLRVGREKKEVNAADAFSPDVRARFLRQVIEAVMKNELKGIPVRSDFRSLLFCTREIPGIPLSLSLSPSAQNVISNVEGDITVEIQRAASSFQATSSDIPNLATTFVENSERCFLEYLHVAFLHPFRDNQRDFFVGRDNTVYARNSSQLPLREGLDIKTNAENDATVSILPGSRGSFFIGQGVGKKAELMFSLDGAASAFHKAMLLSEKLRSYRFGEATQKLRGLDVLAQPSGRVFSVRMFGPPAERAAFKDDKGTSWTVARYYKEKNNVVLKDPKAPCVVVGSAFFPPETLSIQPGQKVKTESMDFRLQNELNQLADPPPQGRQQQVATMAKLLDQQDASNGFRIAKATLQVEARVLPARSMLFGGGAPVAAFRKDYKYDYKPRGAEKLYDGAALRTWALVALSSRFNQLDEFKKALMKRCCDLGMAVDEPLHVGVHSSGRGVSVDDVYAMFEKCMEAGAFFVVVITDIDSKLFELVKSVQFEYQIVTQVIKEKIARETFKPATFDNIAKTVNRKLNGSRYILDMSPKSPAGKIVKEPNTLIIGLSLSFPLRRKATVIGFSANIATPLTQSEKSKAAARQRFPSFFAFAHGAPTEEPKADMDPVSGFERSLENIFSFIIGRAKKTLGGVPQRVLLLLRGAPEGETNLMSRMVLGAWKATYNSSLPPPALHLVVVTKNDNERLYSLDPARRGHVDPGTVVYDQITNPVIPEFFLTPHYVFKGTGKPGRFQLIYDEVPAGRSPITLPDFADAMFSLAHLHQISSSTTSLPAPLNVAQEAVQRGETVLKHLMNGVKKEGFEERLRKSIDDCFDQPYVMNMPDAF